MKRGLPRQATFRTPTDYETFLQVLGETHALWGVEVLAYCLMGNHYHLCLRTPAGNLGRACGNDASPFEAGGVGWRVMTTPAL